VVFKLTGVEVDAAVLQYRGNECKIAVEANGVHHYPRNSERPLGRDVIKRRILEEQGWKVLIVPYFEWCLLEDAQRAGYLEDLILLKLSEQ